MRLLISLEWDGTGMIVAGFHVIPGCLETRAASGMRLMVC